MMTRRFFEWWNGHSVEGLRWEVEGSFRIPKEPAYKNQPADGCGKLDRRSSGRVFTTGCVCSRTCWNSKSWRTYFYFVRQGDRVFPRATVSYNLGCWHYIDHVHVSNALFVSDSHVRGIESSFSSIQLSALDISNHRNSRSCDPHCLARSPTSMSTASNSSGSSSDCRRPYGVIRKLACRDCARGHRFITINCSLHLRLWRSANCSMLKELPFNYADA